MRFLLILFFLLVWQPLICLADSHAPDNSQYRHMLVLHSYHPSLKWCQEINKGLKEGLEDFKAKVIWHEEYMDANRYSSPSYLKKFVELLQLKYSSFKFDVIVCVDNNALEFIIGDGEKLFADTPVIFCGVNFFRPEMISGRRHITGVCENIEALETIRTMLRLQPDINEIVVVNDSMPTGKAWDTAIRQELKISEMVPVKIRFLENSNHEQLLTELNTLDKGKVVLLGVYFGHSEEPISFYEKHVRDICEAASVPVYGLLDINLGYGIVGGKLTKGYTQGFNAGKMTSRILRGEFPRNLSVRNDLLGEFQFDYLQLEKFDIDRKFLPDSSILINKSISYWEKFQIFIISSFIIGLILLVLCAFLSFNLYKKKLLEKELKLANSSLEDKVAERTLSLQESMEQLEEVNSRHELALVEIEQQRDFLQKVIDSMPNIVFLKSPEGKFLMGNKALGRLFKTDIIKMIGHSDDEFITNEDDISKIRRHDIGAMSHPGRVHKIEEIVNVNGVPHYFLVTKVALQLTSDDYQILGVATDITDLKNLEQELEDSREKMEKVVANRFHFLEFALHELAQFSSCAAESKTFKFCLTRQGVEAEKDPRMSSYSCSDRINDILSWMLLYNRREQIASVPVNFHKEIPATVKQVEKARGVKLSDLQVNIEESVPDMIALKADVIRFMLNTLVECFLFNPDEKLGIHVSTYPGNYDHFDLAVEFEYSHSIINQSDIDSALAGKFDGIEEGKADLLVRLTILNNIAKLIDAKFNLQVTPDKELIVTLFFPEVEEATALYEEELKDGDSRKALKILIADDVQLNRELVISYLEDFPFEFIQAQDGLEAVELAQEHHPHLIFMDMKMPVMDGFEAIKTLKSKEELKEIPIIAMTASLMEESIPEVAAICNVYMTKPLSQAGILNAMKEVLPDLKI